MADVDNTQDDKTNFEQVQALIREQVRQHATEFFTEQQRAATTPTSQQQQQQLAHQQIREVIDPVYGADIANARFDAADAKDYATFYRNNPHAVDYEAEIEKQFNDMKANGRPIPRQDIEDWRTGREVRSDPDKFMAKREAQRKAQLERAEAAADVGTYGGKDRNDAVSRLSNFDSKTLEEQEAALDGVTF